MTVKGSQFVELAKTKLSPQPYKPGESRPGYLLGTSTPLDDPNADLFDCAEFVSWLVYQLVQQLVGVHPNNEGVAKADPYTGHWGTDADEGVLLRKIPVAEAISTPGAFLLRRPPSPGVSGHIALSQGNGRTVEAYSTAKGIIESTAGQRRWDDGLVLSSGVEYTNGGLVPFMGMPKSAVVLRMGNPAGVSPLVMAVQQQLIRLGYTVGSDGADGRYGVDTAHAVAAFQLQRGLVSDGEAGPLTMAALKVVK